MPLTLTDTASHVQVLNDRDPGAEQGGMRRMTGVVVGVDVERVYPDEPAPCCLTTALPFRPWLRNQDPVVRTQKDVIGQVGAGPE